MNNKVIEIIKGWKNFYFKSPKHEKMAIDRMSHCIQCPLLSSKNKCNKCGCFMPAKVRNENSKCPLGKW